MPSNPNAELITVREALARGQHYLEEAGVERPGLDMSLILAEAMGVDRLHVYLDMDRPLSPAERDASRHMLARRAKREPLAYILGRREFYGLELIVNPSVLIPRSETELLVDEIVQWLEANAGARATPLLMDLGTGSGAIAVAVAHAFPGARWIATDPSAQALEVARRNAERHDVADRIDFRQAAFFESIDETFDAIVSNPPYVEETQRDKLDPEIRDYEPAGALFSGPDGLDHIRRILAEAPARLQPGGLLMFECGAGQALPIQLELEQHAAWGPSSTVKDLAGIERIVKIERRDES